MPRKKAHDRHQNLDPPTTWPPETDADILAAAVAINHPVRRALYEALDGGPQPVGSLARRLGIQVGSASHHLGVLANAGWIEPAPEMSQDARETWWRSMNRSLSWSVDDFASGTRAHQIATTAFERNIADQGAILKRALAHPSARRSVMTSDWYALATDEQCEDLQRRIFDTVKQWRDELSTSATRGRQPRRIVQWIAPTISRDGALQEPDEPARDAHA